MLKRLNFFFEFFEKNSILPFYGSLVNNTNGKIIINEKIKEIKGKGRGICVCVVNMIPPYFDLEINKENAHYKAFQVKYRTGYIIDLSQYSNVDEYLKSYLGSRHRKNILGRLNKLQSCFSIHYKVYFGEIDDLEFRVLFKELERMIRTRFEQRGEEHVGLKRWDLYEENVYDLILNKRASLFVIYDDKKPIAISLSYHFENILDSAITSYDIDYAKFGLGNIELLQKLEWCFENNYKRLDMRWGELRYKRLWCNAIEEYNCDVVYNNNLIAMPIAFAVAKLIIIKKLLLHHKILPLKFSFKLWDRQKSNTNLEMEDAPIYRTIDLDELPLKNEISAIDFNEKEYHFLLNPLYNYQYANSEHTRDIKIYRVIDEKGSYIVEGKSNVQKLKF
jgi:hypothetical protein